jgi:general nucleoside transport system permease protein
MPALALATAFLLGAIAIWVTSGSLETVFKAYEGMVRGALFKERGLSESLVASIPYILLSLGVAVGFKAGLFNIGVEGQFYIGAVAAAWAGQALQGWPAILHLPFVLLIGALGGAIWAAIPGYLRARTGAHEVINTIMMNYVAFRLTEFIVSGPLKAPSTGTVQTPRIAASAELWSLADVPQRLSDPLNALGVALVVVFLIWVAVRWRLGRSTVGGRARKVVGLGLPAIAGVLAFFVLPAATQTWWPFTDAYDRMHVGLLLALIAAGAVWWLFEKTTIGFELRTVGANPNAARYAGISITRNIVLAMAISGALAGLAGTVEVLGVTICRCLPLFFSSGYGFDSIAIALLAKSHPLGIIVASFLFGAMRNGADLMELTSGVSKYVISVLQALVLLFVAAPAIMRWLYRIRAVQRVEDEGPVARGWGG